MRKLLIGIVSVLSLVSCGGGRAVSTTVASSQNNVKVTFYSDAIVRVEKYPLGTECPENVSFSVTKTPQKVSFTTEKKDGNLIYTTSRIKVEVSLSDGNVSFYSVDGGRLLSEKPGSFSLTPFNDAGRETFSVSQRYLLDEGEAVYGLGQHQQGYMNQRGKRVELHQENMEVAMPFIQSVKGYGVYWDNTSRSVYSDGKDGLNFSFEVGDKLDYYFTYGGNADGVIAAVRDLTGDVPMNPLWVYGFNQSRERYGSAAELVGIVSRYRELQVPLDGIIQDWRYWGENNCWNAVDFLDPGYADPHKMMSDIHNLNAHCLISVWPSFGPDSEIFKEFAAKGKLFTFDTFPDEGTRNYDPFDAEARDIYWSYMSKNLYSTGIDGWWLDATEPEGHRLKQSDYDNMTPYGTYRSLFNAYPIASVGGVYDHQRAQDSSKRVMILTRSASFGQQRYASHVWSGDVVGTWEVLASQIPAALNYSSCGMGYWNSDIGGFYPNKFPGGYRNPGFAKLYTRWMQFAAFTGMMRSHGTGTPREIFRFGKRGDEIFDAQDKFINLRYRLLPYIYSTAAEISFRQGTLMRALYMDWPEDRNVYEISDEYMFGRNILVAPVVTEDDNRDVYLPAGKWYDFFSGEISEGNRTVHCVEPISEMPLFVKAGTVLPVGPQVQYSSEKKWDSLQIRVYPGADGHFVLYEDEGDNYNYEKGEYSEIPFDWNESERTLTIGERKGRFDGMLSQREFRIVVAGDGKALGLDEKSCDRSVRYDGSETKVRL